MILTVTLNAAIDRTLAVPNFRLGRRHRAVEQTAIAGGKGVNVARALRSLGRPVLATGAVGGGTGARIIEFLGHEEIPNDFVHVTDESRMSTAVIDPTDGVTTEINERGPALTGSEEAQVTERILYLAQGARICVLCGSLPRGLPVDLYGRLIEALRKNGVVTVLDCEGEPLRIGTRAQPGERPLAEGVLHRLDLGDLGGVFGTQVRPLSLVSCDGSVLVLLRQRAQSRESKCPPLMFLDLHLLPGRVAQHHIETGTFPEEHIRKLNRQVNGLQRHQFPLYRFVASTVDRRFGGKRRWHEAEPNRDRGVAEAFRGLCLLESLLVRAARMAHFRLGGLEGGCQPSQARAGLLQRCLEVSGEQADLTGVALWIEHVENLVERANACETVTPDNAMKVTHGKAGGERVDPDRQSRQFYGHRVEVYAVDAAACDLPSQ